MRTEQEINEIRGKLLVNQASQGEIYSFLEYVQALEGLLVEADQDDMFGTEGHEGRLGWV